MSATLPISTIQINLHVFVKSQSVNLSFARQLAIQIITEVTLAGKGS